MLNQLDRTSARKLSGRGKEGMGTERSVDGNPEAPFWNYDPACATTNTEKPARGLDGAEAGRQKS